MNDLETIFAKIIGLIEVGHKDFPDGNFYVKIPSDEWRMAERSLDRSAVARFLAQDYFVWRGEYVKRGEPRDLEDGAWTIWPVVKPV